MYKLKGVKLMPFGPSASDPANRQSLPHRLGNVCLVRILSGMNQCDLCRGRRACNRLKRVAFTCLNCFLVSLAAGGEDVVESFLLGPILLLIVSFALIVEHIQNGFEIAMGSVVNLHLPLAIELQRVKTI